MVVYWDAVMLFNFLTDYLLLYGAMRLAGRDIGRRRLALGALLGALYAAVQLLLPRSFLLMAFVFLAIGAVAFAGTGRAVKLTMLFGVLCCAFGGGVLLLGQCAAAEKLARGLVYAELPWSVFFLTAAGAYLLFGVFFRGSAERSGAEVSEVTVVYRGKSVCLRLLHDSGNALCAPSGVGIPVISAVALRPLIAASECTDRVAYHSVGRADGTLPSFLCDRFVVDGAETPIRQIALTEEKFGNGFVGILPCETEGIIHARKIMAEV